MAISEPLPATARETSAERPWPLRLLSAKIDEYVAKMSPVWVEGQLVQINRRPGASMTFMTLRDTASDMSMSVSMFARDFDRIEAPLTDGAHVVVHAKPTFWAKRGSLQLQAKDVKAVGLGALLARLEELKRLLAAEGLFDADRKVALPFLPARIGLVCGRESKAEHDVVVNARARFPAIEFDIREVAVQGAYAVAEVSAAIEELDKDPAIDVIIVARGGGSVEDLLPFSNERLVRVAGQCATPLVSAIGHETDAPLLDLVADYRASTPTDAARRVVPDVVEDADSFVGNARLKARALLEATGMAAVADDSGLEVEALGGEPGVYSARFGNRPNDLERNLYLLEKLRDKKNRRAKFVSVIVLAYPDGVVEEYRGEVPGVILEGPRGAGGFGYDPLFMPYGETSTFAEMSVEDKRAISHRGKALEALKAAHQTGKARQAYPGEAGSRLE